MIIARDGPIMPAMADSKAAPAFSGTTHDAPYSRVAPLERAACNEDAMLCERCGKAEMFRMHAVWRCPECGFKTDCCGW